MAVRTFGQLSLADGLMPRACRSGVKLAELERLIDWAAVSGLFAGLRGSRYGAPAYPPLLLLKAMLLQQWYGLSDPGLEDALYDRLSFRRFVGLTLDDAVPDHSTICRFRSLLVKEGLGERVFGEVTRQLDGRGLILRQGTMIDATLVEAQVRRPGKPTSAAPDEPSAADPETPAPPVSSPDRPPSKLVRSVVDPEAGWAKKGHTRYFGYKGHVAVDWGSGLIRRVRLTSASVADTTVADELIMMDERAVYADKAYDTKARRARLKAAGIKDRISHRPNRHHPLTARQAQRNAGIARRRSGVERVFAKAKCAMGWWRVRYRGVAKNACHFALMCTAMNLSRLLVLTP